MWDIIFNRIDSTYCFVEACHEKRFVFYGDELIVLTYRRLDEIAGR